MLSILGDGVVMDDVKIKLRNTEDCVACGGSGVWQHLNIKEMKYEPEPCWACEVSEEN
jgi:hypothetical protein